MDQEPDSLLSIAGAVAEEAVVSWDDELRLADDASAATLRGLQEIAKILAAQRVIQREFDSTTKRGTPGSDAVPPARWRHLLILDKIGEGSFGAVYRAYESQLALDVALKLIPTTGTARTKSPERVLSEAQLLARVRDPNVVTVYGVDRTDDYVGVWMEFIKGRTLGELLKTHGPFTAPETALIGRDLCRAVEAVHQAGVLHGDIKAHNVMRQENGRTVLMDFGAGRRLVDDRSTEAMRSLAGTPLYLAPEVLDGRPPTIASDIYSLGILLYHLVTGSYPVRGNSLAEIALAHKRGERVRLREAYPDLPENFVRIVEQATAVDPAQRFAAASAFADALAPLTSEKPSESGGRSHEKASFNQLPRQLMLLAVLVLVATVGAAVWLARPITSVRPSAPVANAPTTPTTSPVGSPASGDYEIDAGFYRAGANGDEKLTPGVRVKPGDELFLKFQASVPVNVYVVNEDDKGESFLLFPLPGQRVGNPIQPGQEITLPGTVRWKITSAGGREHFVVFASPDRMEAFEQVFASLATPRENAPVLSASLQPRTIERLRSVGGLTASPPPQTTATGLSQLFTAPLTNARETVHGLWIRQITLDNPAR